MKLASGPADPAGTLTFSSPANAAHLSRLNRSGRAVRLAAGIYIVDADLRPEDLSRLHRFAIISHFWPGAVLGDRTAFTGGDPADGWLFIIHPEPERRADLRLPGLTISPRVGPGRLPADMPLPHGLYLTGTARGLVDNVSLGGRPPHNRPARAAGALAVEDQIDTLARTGGSGRIRMVLAQLDVVAASLPRTGVDLVRRRLAGVLGTCTGSLPSSARLRARLAGEPFDAARLDMFAAFAATLRDTAPRPRPAVGVEHWRWLPFFEAYFSNFIEGTEFGVEEARRIVADGYEPAGRPEDAHDVLATYRLATDPVSSRRTPRSAAEFVDILRDLHAVLMAARPDKNPGVFKSRPNYAGGFAFVAPELVLGTLERGFDCFADLTDPFGRAAALMILVTECHPFDDGNGRLARLVANAALSAAGQVRIVLPTSYRNDYLAGLSGVSNRAGRGESMLAVLDFAQRWTAAVDWSSFAGANGLLAKCNAYVDAAAAEASGRRLVLPA